MIKQLPGWANFLLLWFGYLVLTAFLHLMYEEFIFTWKNFRFDMIITSVYCGCYLAKWRFIDGKWRFR